MEDDTDKVMKLYNPSDISVWAALCFTQDHIWSVAKDSVRSKRGMHLQNWLWNLCAGSDLEVHLCAPRFVRIGVTEALLVIPIAEARVKTSEIRFTSEGIVFKEMPPADAAACKEVRDLFGLDAQEDVSELASQFKKIKTMDALSLGQAVAWFPQIAAGVKVALKDLSIRFVPNVDEKKELESLSEMVDSPEDAQWALK